MKTLIAVVAGAAAVAPALGQCSYTVSMWEAFRAGQATEGGKRQTAGDAFSFHENGHNGPLLTSVRNNVSLPYSWGNPAQPFNIPQAGPIFSADPLIAQNPFHDRAAGFTGIMMHPGYENRACTAVFTAQTVMMVSSLQLSTEVLGNASNGASTTLTYVTAGGAESPLAGPVTSLWGQPAQHTPVLPITPIVMQPGDRVVVVTTANGAPTEDWLNVELSLEATASAPVILAQPRGVATCPGGSVTLSVAAVGAGGPGPLSGYRWQREEVDVPGGGAPTLTLTGVTAEMGGRYRCIVSGTCGQNVSRYATLLVRTADVGSTGGVDGGDGVLDNNDFVVFIDRFFSADVRADYGAAGGSPGPDGGFDNNDFVVFIDLFFSGCV
ncbi:MAG TPA: immunoglobulin domain-containing protein [Phycisphaerales bacterium]|nr:immunoglobulin domain-containing protein [Phycisphaerales bacterium]